MECAVKRRREGTSPKKSYVNSLAHQLTNPKQKKNGDLYKPVSCCKVVRNIWLFLDFDNLMYDLLQDALSWRSRIRHSVCVSKWPRPLPKALDPESHLELKDFVVCTLHQHSPKFLYWTANSSPSDSQSLIEQGFTTMVGLAHNNFSLSLSILFYLFETVSSCQRWHPLRCIVEEKFKVQKRKLFHQNEKEGRPFWPPCPPAFQNLFGGGTYTKCFCQMGCVAEKVRGLNNMSFTCKQCVNNQECWVAKELVFAQSSQQAIGSRF